MKSITSLEHPLVKYWVRLKTPHFRKEHNRLLIEGLKLVQDVAKNHKLLRLITTRDDIKVDAEESYLVSTSVLKKISGVEASEGVVAELAVPAAQPLDLFSKIVVLDRIQDPGNLGAIIRSALALGWEGIYLLPGCCDPFNDKALRAAMGATFCLPICSGTWEELSQLCQKNEAQLVVSDMEGEDVAKVRFKKAALVLGNEGQGVAIPAHLAHAKVKIPMHASFDSLNVAVAGAILMYALM